MVSSSYRRNALFDGFPIPCFLAPNDGFHFCWIPPLKVSSSSSNEFHLSFEGFPFWFADTLFHGELVLKFETLPQSLFDSFPGPVPVPDFFVADDRLCFGGIPPLGISLVLWDW